MAVATGSQTVYVAGQVAHGGRTPVGPGDLAAPVERTYLDVATALGAVGGTFDDVAELTLYVVDRSSEKPAGLGAGVGRVAQRLGVDPTEPIIHIPVSALTEPDLLIEVEAVAVLP